MYYLTYILIYFFIGLYFGFPSLGDSFYKAQHHINFNYEVDENIKISDKGFEIEYKSNKKTPFKANSYSSLYNSLFSSSLYSIFFSDFISSQTEYFSFQTKLKETYLSKMLC